MAETEVESILREIRERVLLQQRSTPGHPEIANGGNGAGESRIAHYGDNQRLTAENLALINSYLTTTARAWDRLPPLVSNRSGFVARLELWLKRRLRAGTRWFTWEQVNFNAAVHHVLRDMLQVLTTHELELRELRAQAAQIEEIRLAMETQRIQVDSRLAEFAGELRERIERLEGEQRVSFKQLALETSEAAVLEDRARRQNESLLQELSRRVEQLEKK